MAAGEFSTKKFCRNRKKTQRTQQERKVEKVKKKNRILVLGLTFSMLISSGSLTGCDSAAGNMGKETTGVEYEEADYELSEESCSDSGIDAADPGTVDNETEKTAENRTDAEKSTETEESQTDNSTDSGLWKKASTTPYGKYPELVTYTLGQMSGANNSNLPAGNTYEDSAYTRYLKEILNVQNENAYMEREDRYDEYVNVLVNDHTLPDVLVVSDRETLKELVDNDLVEDLSEVYENCTSERIKEMFESYGSGLLDSVRFNGKLMAIPETVTDHGPRLMWLRKDWMDKLGLEDPKTLEVLRKAAADSITACVRELERQHQLPENSCIAMTIGGNTTMIHFLLGMDAFCVFHTPYAVHADRPGFLPARDLELPVKGYVYIYPAKSNYLGGDIISGMVATGIYKKEKIHAFFDIGTNGELVLGNRDFLLCGAGAAGPALEGGVVKTGMRAMEGAVDRVKLKNGELHCHVIGETAAKGICGSGIVDLLAELFLHGWIDIRGVLQPEKSRKIMEKDGMLAVNYAPDLYFYQSDIEEFIRTKAAAYTMVAIMLRESGIELSELEGFYVAGAFGKHVSKESAIAIGMYPDMDRERIIHAGNSSLEGAVCALLDRNVTKEVEEILEKMVVYSVWCGGRFPEYHGCGTGTATYRYRAVSYSKGKNWKASGNRNSPRILRTEKTKPS